MGNAIQSVQKEAALHAAPAMTDCYSGCSLSPTQHACRMYKRSTKYIFKHNITCSLLLSRNCS
jgi:hypothetical protein